MTPSWDLLMPLSGAALLLIWAHFQSFGTAVAGLVIFWFHYKLTDATKSLQQKLDTITNQVSNEELQNRLADLEDEVNLRRQQEGQAAETPGTVHLLSHQQTSPSSEIAKAVEGIDNRLKEVEANDKLYYEQLEKKVEYVVQQFLSYDDGMDKEAYKKISNRLQSLEVKGKETQLNLQRIDTQTELFELQIKTLNDQLFSENQETMKKKIESMEVRMETIYEEAQVQESLQEIKFNLQQLKYKIDAIEGRFPAHEDDDAEDKSLIVTQDIFDSMSSAFDNLQSKVEILEQIDLRYEGVMKDFKSKIDDILERVGTLENTCCTQEIIDDLYKRLTVLETTCITQEILDEINESLHQIDMKAEHAEEKIDTSLNQNVSINEKMSHQETDIMNRLESFEKTMKEMQNNIENFDSCYVKEEEMSKLAYYLNDINKKVQQMEGDIIMHGNQKEMKTYVDELKNETNIKMQALSETIDKIEGSDGDFESSILEQKLEHIETKLDMLTQESINSKFDELKLIVRDQSSNASRIHSSHTSSIEELKSKLSIIEDCFVSKDNFLTVKSSLDSSNKIIKDLQKMMQQFESKKQESTSPETEKRLSQVLENANKSMSDILRRIEDKMKNMDCKYASKAMVDDLYNEVQLLKKDIEETKENAVTADDISDEGETIDEMKVKLALLEEQLSKLKVQEFLNIQQSHQSMISEIQKIQDAFRACSEKVQKLDQCKATTDAINNLAKQIETMDHSVQIKQDDLDEMWKKIESIEQRVDETKMMTGDQMKQMITKEIAADLQAMFAAGNENINTIITQLDVKLDKIRGKSVSEHEMEQVKGHLTEMRAKLKELEWSHSLVTDGLTKKLEDMDRMLEALESKVQDVTDKKWKQDILVTEQSLKNHVAVINSDLATKINHIEKQIRKIDKTVSSLQSGEHVTEASGHHINEERVKESIMSEVQSDVEEMINGGNAALAKALESVDTRLRSCEQSFASQEDCEVNKKSISNLKKQLKSICELPCPKNVYDVILVEIEKITAEKDKEFDQKFLTPDGLYDVLKQLSNVRKKIRNLEEKAGIRNSNSTSHLDITDLSINSTDFEKRIDELEERIDLLQAHSSNSGTADNKSVDKLKSKLKTLAEQAVTIEDISEMKRKIELHFVTKSALDDILSKFSLETKQMIGVPDDKYVTYDDLEQMGQPVSMKSTTRADIQDIRENMKVTNKRIDRMESSWEQQFIHLLKLHNEYNWVQFDMPELGQDIESPRFSIRGYTMSLHLQVSEHCVDVYPQIHPGPHDQLVTWPMTGVLHVTYLYSDGTKTRECAIHSPRSQCLARPRSDTSNDVFNTCATSSCFYHTYNAKSPKLVGIYLSFGRI